MVVVWSLMQSMLWIIRNDVNPKEEVSRDGLQ